MRSKDVIIALAIIFIVLIVGLYFMVQKQKANAGVLPKCTAHSCGI